MSAKKELIQVPDNFICPLTLECMVTPMMSRTGHNFERASIVQWIKETGSHPLTRQPMTLRDLVPNPALREQIQGWKKLNQGALLLSDSSVTDACSDDDDSDSDAVDDRVGPLVCVSVCGLEQLLRDEKAKEEARARRQSRLSVVVVEEEANNVAATDAAAATTAANSTSQQGRRRGFLRFGRRQKA